jgi:hypothetical protein
VVVRRLPAVYEERAFTKKRNDLHVYGEKLGILHVVRRCVSQRNNLLFILRPNLSNRGYCLVV